MKTRVTSWSLRLLLSGAALLAAGSAQAIPSFARQTNMPCAACHTVFPELTPFGRSFKLSGYTLSAQPQVSQEAGHETAGLSINNTAPLSIMLQASLTHLKQAEAGTQNNDLQLPQQLSLFYGGRIADKLGAFIQMTYSQNDGSIGMDNTDVRYADTGTARGVPVIYGVTVNNNPTVQDPWNTLPAWGLPAMSSASAPTPSASALLGNLGGNGVTGLGGYALFDNAFYSELTLYRSSQQGQSKPNATASDNVLAAAAPYIRLAWQHQAANGDYLMLGMNDLSAQQYRNSTGGVTGPRDKYNDLTVDTQYEHPLAGDDMIVMHASLTREKQTLDASSPGFDPTLKTFKLDGSYHWGNESLLTLGVWNTKGDTGDYTNTYGYIGDPASRGWLGQVSYLPWQNTRLSVTYTAYNRFDNLPAGRSASANNSAFLQGWVVW